MRRRIRSIASRLSAPVLLIGIVGMGLALSAPGVGAAGGANGADDAETKIQITKKDCRRIIRHQLANDVIYKPGIGFDGHKAVAADGVDAARIAVPEVIEFNISRDLGAYLGKPDADAAAAQATANAAAVAEPDAAAANTATQAAYEKAAKIPAMPINLGTVKFNVMTGALSFNEKPMTDARSAEIAARCRDIMGNTR